MGAISRAARRIYARQGLLIIIIAALALLLGVLFLICTWKLFYGKKGKKAKHKARPRYEDE